MGFYGNVSNAGKTNMVFDKIYSSRVDMEAACDGDGVYAGRYVLIEYEKALPDDTIDIVYAPASDNTLNTLYYDMSCTRPYDSNSYTEGKIYHLRKVNNDTITLNKYYLYSKKTFIPLADFGGDTPEAQLPGLGNSSEANYIINFNKDKFFYENIKGYDSTVWMKSFYTDGKQPGKGYYINIAELNSVVPSFGITVDAPTEIPKGPYFDTDSTNIYYDLHLQPSWGLRVKKATKTKDDKSDINISYPTWNSTTKTITYNNEAGAIYFNKKGFSEYEYENSVDTTTNNFIKITPGKSGRYYNGTSENDLYELSVQLPAIGNMMSKAWDIIHGPERDDPETDGIKNEDGTIKSYDSLQGRLNSFNKIKKGDIPYKWENGTFIGMTPAGDGAWITADVTQNGDTHNFNIAHIAKFSNDNNPSGEKESLTLNIGNKVSIPYVKYDNAGHITGEAKFDLSLPNPLANYALDTKYTGKINTTDTLVTALNKLENSACMAITQGEIDGWNSLEQADWSATEGMAAIRNKPTNFVMTDTLFNYTSETDNQTLQQIISNLTSRIKTLEDQNPTTE